MTKTKRPPAAPTPAEPPPEIFRRTPEQKAADAARLDAEVKRMIARGVPPDLGDGAQAIERPAGDYRDALADLRKHADEWQSERRALPCWRAVYPSGPPENFLDRAVDSQVAIKGRLGCKASTMMVPDGAGGRVEVAQIEGCRYAHQAPTCLWDQAVAMAERAATNLTMALGTEAAEEHKLVLAALDLDAPKPLRDTDPWLVARAWAAGGKRRFILSNAAKLAPLTGDELAGGAPTPIELLGEERLMIWGGNPGRGKTVAAIWLLARRGGLYVLEAQLGRKVDVDRLAGVGGVLVVDQFQPTDPDEHRRCARRLDEIVHRRFAAGRKTLIIGNVDYLTFASRLGQVEAGDDGRLAVVHPGNVAERCAQAGALILFGGDSMRA